jgi:hypothetical protein
MSSLHANAGEALLTRQRVMFNYKRQIRQEGSMKNLPTGQSFRKMTDADMAVADRLGGRHFFSTNILGPVTARVKRTTRDDIHRRRDIAFEDDSPGAFFSRPQSLVHIRHR